MADFDAVRDLRALSGVSISRCKSALEQSGGDKDKALEILRKEGIEIAAKKSTRATNAGVVDAYLHGDRRLGAIIEVKCETDFVARTDEFRAFVHDLAMQAAAAAPESIADMLTQPFLKDPKKTVGDYVKEIIAKFGENVEVIGFSRLEL